MATKVINLKVVSGLTPVGNSFFFVSYNKEEIIIEEKIQSGFRMKLVNTYRIKMDNMVQVIVVSNDEIIEKSKSVIGRAAVGFAFGPLGAIVGGMSGIGKKQKVNKDYYFAITYKNKDGELSNILFDVNGATVRLPANNFVREVSKLIPIQEIETPVVESGVDIEL